MDDFEWQMKVEIWWYLLHVLEQIGAREGRL